MPLIELDESFENGDERAAVFGVRERRSLARASFQLIVLIVKLEDAQLNSIS